MNLVLRTFVVALIFSALIFILGANNIFSIKDDFVDYSLDQEKEPYQVPVNLNRDAFFGDLHVHTRYSFDAFILEQQPLLMTPINTLKADP